MTSGVRWLAEIGEDVSLVGRAAGVALLIFTILAETGLSGPAYLVVFGVVLAALMYE